VTRPVLEKVAKVHRDAELPKYFGKTFVKRAAAEPPAVNQEGPSRKAEGGPRKALLYATCFVNYNNPGIGEAALKVLARNGVDCEVLYPGCCGMPQLEQGKLDSVADSAKLVAGTLGPWIDKGYDVVALTPSCALMLKFEWPLLLPSEPGIEKLSKATFDITEYVVHIAKKDGLAEPPSPLEGGVALHMACHARAQNIGAKAAEMLRLIPETKVKVIERCSGHGGSWGVMKDNFEANGSGSRHLASECPLAGVHLLQGIERLDGESALEKDRAYHPIELFAKACGLL
jgi:glycerol-3-phosphate dehydrogenase subunit C